MFIRKSVFGVLAAGMLAVSVPAFSQQETPKKAEDNTKVNERDRSKTMPTADNAKNKTTDRELMANIRKAVMDDKSLSSYAHNVKIIARNGKVTLRGPVRSEEEKRTIEQKATEVAGAGNVTNDITIKPEKTSKKSDKS